MATSIITNFTSGKWYTSANLVTATVDSNFNGKCNFRYICDIYINGTKVYTSKLFPDPSTGYGFFNISRVIQDYIDTKINLTPPDMMSYAAESSAPTSAISVYCKFGEEYDSSTDCDGIIQQYNNQVTSDTFYVYEAAVDYEDYPTYDYTNYLVGTASATTTKFLTNSPRTIDVHYNESHFLDFITDQTINSNWSVEILAYSTLGTTASWSYTCPALSNRKRYRIACGPYDINKEWGDTRLNQFINKYQVHLAYNGTQVTEKFTFKPKKPNTFSTRVGFVGQLGGIESFNFYHRNKKMYDLEKKSYQQTLHRKVGNSLSYSVGNRGRKTYKVKARESHSVGTFCSKAASEWLYELWLSPAVWIYSKADMLPFRLWREDSSPTSRMLFFVKDHNYEVGDTLVCLPDNKVAYSNYNDEFTIVGIEGDMIDCGITYNIYSTTETACGYLYKQADWQTLPVTTSNASMVEVKQRLDKPIQYQLDYKMAYTKNVLKG